MYVASIYNFSESNHSPQQIESITLLAFVFQ